MSKIAALALNTYRETVRDKVLYIILLFALGIALISSFVSRWSASQEEKILQDFGMFIMTMFGLVIAVFIGINLVYREVEKRTIYAVISKPVSRVQFIWGKYLGLLLTVLSVLAMMGAGLYIVLYIFAGVFNPMLSAAIGLLFFELAIITAFALFFSTITSPVLSSILTLFVFLAGNVSAGIIQSNRDFETGLFGMFMQTLYYLVPNMELFDIQREVVHGLQLNPADIASAIFYGIVYSTVLVMISAFIFSRKSMK